MIIIITILIIIGIIGNRFDSPLVPPEPSLEENSGWKRDTILT
jgi:hypothetical protein